MNYFNINEYIAIILKHDNYHISSRISGLSLRKDIDISSIRSEAIYIYNELPQTFYK